MKKSTKYLSIIATCLLVAAIILSIDLWINYVVTFIQLNWPLCLIFCSAIWYLISPNHADHSELSSKIRYEQTEKLDNQLNNSKN